MLELQNKAHTLKDIYESIALSEDERTTASDFYLRELEIDFGLECIKDGDVVLDVGCGPGVALQAYATKRKIEAHGIDYAENMVAFAKKRLNEINQSSTQPLTIHFKQGSVTELPYNDSSFDVVTSHRCLMALLDWDLQCHAINEITRVLKPGGIFVLMEGTVEGIDKLNKYRNLFELPEIDPKGTDRLLTLKFKEETLLNYMKNSYELLRTKRFGMYYFLTRIIQPLLVAPEKPRYDHKLNQVARLVANIIPDFDGIGHLVAFCFKKISK